MGINPQWIWRAVALDSEDYEFRLLVQMRQDKPNYKAWLAVKTTEGWAMVARLESHSHAGLHCHAECGPGGGLTVGEIEPADMLSFPYWKSAHRRPHVLRGKKEWWELALKFFRAHAAARGDLL